MNKTNGKPKTRTAPAPKISREEALRRLCLQQAANLLPTDKGRLAAQLLEEAPLDREVFDAFWASLDEAFQEELAAWIALRLDGDEHEAALVG